MDPNNKKKPSRNGKNGSNWRGLITLVCWALLLTTIFSYASSYINSAGHQASNVEIDHSD